MLEGPRTSLIARYEFTESIENRRAGASLSIGTKRPAFSYCSFIDRRSPARVTVGGGFLQGKRMYDAASYLRGRYCVSSLVLVAADSSVSCEPDDPDPDPLSVTRFRPLHS